MSTGVGVAGMGGERVLVEMVDSHYAGQPGQLVENRLSGCPRHLVNPDNAALVPVSPVDPLALHGQAHRLNNALADDHTTVGTVQVTSLHPPQNYIRPVYPVWCNKV